MAQRISTFFNDHLIAIVIISTFVILFAVVLIPTIYVFVYSFFEVHISGSMRFVGLRNFAEALSDPGFWRYLGQTLIYTFGSVALSFLIAFSTALALNRIKTGRTVFRSLILLPWLIPPAISGLTWRWMFNDTNGLINDILVNRLGIVSRNILFLGTHFWAKVSIIVTDSWTRIPFMCILLLAALQGIPRDHYDAAEVDGASAFQRLRLVTIPLIRSTIVVTLLIVTMFVLRTYEIIYLLTDGGPGDSTEVLTTHIYKNLVNYWRMGYGSALSVLLLIIVIGVTLYYVRQLSRATER